MKSQVRHFADTHQRAFVKLFDSVCQRHNRWEAFSDFVHMASISVSNTVDKSHAEEREKSYLRMAAQYSQKELECFAHMFAEIVEGLEADPDQDFMGKLFMNLNLGNQYRGQFFTPYNVSRMMAEVSVSKEELQARIQKQGWIAVNDCACGAGGLLVAFANTCTRYEVNYQSSVLFTAQDVDHTAGFMCYLQLSLLGCPGYVVIANTITNPATCIDKRGLIPIANQETWYTPLYFLPEWHYRRQFAYMDLLIASAVPVSVPVREEREAAAPVKQPAPPKAAPESVTLDLNETKTGQLTFF